MLTCQICFKPTKEAVICPKCAKLTVEEVVDKLKKGSQLKPLKAYRRTNSKDVFVGALNGSRSS